MSKIYFSIWQDELIDNRSKTAGDIKDTAFKLPFEFDKNQTTKAFVGWSGFAVFNKNTDIVQLATNYARQYQEYAQACGRCAPGRWGGRILYDLLDKNRQRRW